MTANDVRRLGRFVEDARVRLYDSQAAAAAAAGVGTTLWGLMEGGKRAPKNRAKKAAIERTLHWPPGAIDRILAGESIEAADNAVSRVELLAATLDSMSVRLSELERVHQEAIQLARLVQQDYEGPAPPEAPG